MARLWVHGRGMAARYCAGGADSAHARMSRSAASEHTNRRYMLRARQCRNQTTGRPNGFTDSIDRTARTPAGAAMALEAATGPEPECAGTLRRSYPASPRFSRRVAPA